MEFKNILCPVDFSEVSRESLKTAVDLAQRHDAGLLVVHVVHDIPWMFPPVPMMPVKNVDFQKDMEKSARSTLDEMLDEIVPKSLPVDTLVSDGDAGTRISEIATERNCDLIVIASREKTVMNRLLFGSVAEKVIRSSPCAVLVLKAD